MGKGSKWPKAAPLGINQDQLQLALAVVHGKRSEQGTRQRSLPRTSGTGDEDM